MDNTLFLWPNIIDEYIQEENLEFICEALESNTTLTELDIKGNGSHSLFNTQSIFCLFIKAENYSKTVRRVW